MRVEGIAGYGETRHVVASTRPKRHEAAPTLSTATHRTRISPDFLCGKPGLMCVMLGECL